jgi:acid phosphatase (class A)
VIDTFNRILLSNPFANTAWDFLTSPSFIVMGSEPKPAPRPRNSPLPVLALLVALCLPAAGQSLYFPNGLPDGIALLPPPPARGSAEEAADLDCVRAVCKARTSDEEARAMKSSSLAFSLFAPAIGPSFDLTKLPRTTALLQQVKKEIGTAIDLPKEHFKRLRPYQLDDQLSVGKPEPSFSYPSGHSTRGTVYALVLAEIFRDKREAILAEGREIGWHRVLIAKHFPSDVYAGRVLGQAIVNSLLTNASFQRDLVEAKAEVASAGLAKSTH